MTRMKTMAILFFSLLLCEHALAFGEHCGATFLADRPGSKAAILRDPSGKQKALFDLSWGAMLVSLTYTGPDGTTSEYVAAPNTVSGGQTILRATNYTPTMGGDSGNNGALVMGAACSGLKHLWISSGMIDYNANIGASTGFIFANSQWHFSRFSAPYVVNTHAYFVPNAGAGPSYYLRIDRTISNIDGENTAPTTFTLDNLLSIPTSYSVYSASPACTSATPCANSTPSVAAGYYTSSLKDKGVALATFPASYWNGQGGNVQFATETFADRRTLHLNRSSFSIPRQSSKTYSMLVMVGPWTGASAYAAKACQFTVTRPGADTHSANAAGPFRINVATAAGCAWEVRNNASWISVVKSPNNDFIEYTVSANTATSDRGANLYVAGQIFPVFQKKFPQ